jgi:hypothetical protein
MKKQNPELDELFPAAGRPAAVTPTSMRFSAPLLARVDALARSRLVTRTEMLEKLVAWALDHLGQVEAGKRAVDEVQRRRGRVR